MTTYATSLWEQGKDLGSGRIAWMRPLNQSLRGANLIGPVGLALEALETAAQFAMWFELHQMRRLMEANFEERRHAWLNNIFDQWIEEHQNGDGIRRDISNAMTAEASAFVQAVAENARISIPQQILLKATRIADYLDSVYTLHAKTLQGLVSATRSASGWAIPAELDTRQATHRLLTAKNDEAETRWKSHRKVALGLIPLGPFLALRSFLGSWLALRQTKDATQRAADVAPLIRLEISLRSVDWASSILWTFMNIQGLQAGSMLLVSASDHQGRILVYEPGLWRRFRSRVLRWPVLTASVMPSDLVPESAKTVVP